MARTILAFLIGFLVGAWFGVILLAIVTKARYLDDYEKHYSDKENDDWK